jgi:hypothetical protein
MVVSGEYASAGSSATCIWITSYRRSSAAVGRSSNHKQPPIGWVSPFARITFPACRAHYSSGSKRVHVSIGSPRSGMTSSNAHAFTDCRLQRSFSSGASPLNRRPPAEAGRSRRSRKNFRPGYGIDVCQRRRRSQYAFDSNQNAPGARLICRLLIQSGRRVHPTPTYDPALHCAKVTIAACGLS